MLDILSTVNEWLQASYKIALATVVETWGSSPRQAGAKMAVRADMAMVGSVSGGCVETAVVSEALDSLEDGKPRLLNYGVSDDTAWDVGLSCGGRISIYVEPLDKDWWQIACGTIQQDRYFKTIISLADESAGQKLLIDNGEIIFASPNMTPHTRTTLQAASTSLTTKRLTLDESDILVDNYQPRPRLVIIGGAHVAMALKNFAHQLGFRVVLIDPRKAFATPERFPDVELISHSYPDKVLPTLDLTEDTYIAVLTHDPKIDDPALIVTLSSPVAYIGVLSSKRTHEKRLNRLTEAGIDPLLFDRISTPIGLDIAAQTPEEIALCIMAEIVAVRNGAIKAKHSLQKASVGAS